ncbi:MULTISPECIES: hypothetical protein [Sphingobacterium]|jgi:hypothetical protein|uniref:hypothetical protein n=1 Tax=Sphingobacterium TaxID=28453 RepID=UPI001601FB21|nr:hypothetical protein [Sphingobacterium sp. UME9]MBB1645700.1 hypothetical protein [Sphingobacterium sp. UME9]
MKRLLLLLVLFAITLASCNKDSVKFQSDLSAGLPNKPQATIPTDAAGIITKTTLSADTVWKIDGVAFVRPGVTLTIEAGTYITSGVDKAYYDEVTGLIHNIKGVLVVPKKAKLIANGTAAAPIVFTSPKAAGSRNPGDFGGVVLLGRAITNQPRTRRIDGIPRPVGVDVTYGDINSEDNSGSLKYVRIEFAGYLLNDESLTNGLTLAGVGSGTTLENIQVSCSRSDGFGFYGGKVNAKYLVALSNADDDFDFTHGYSGSIQYALSLKDPNQINSTSSGRSDSNGLESDNEGTAPYSATPKTRPVLRNFTFLGIKDTTIAAVKLKFGNCWRRLSEYDIQNSIIAGYATGVSFQHGATGTFTGNVVHAYRVAFSGAIPAGNQTDVSADATTYLKLAGGANIFYSTIPYHPAALRPMPTSPAYGDGSTTYKGAFHPSTPPWTVGWTQFAPKTY